MRSKVWSAAFLGYGVSMKKKYILAVMPARGGSKRIPKKNIKDFCEKPMMSWPLNILKKIDFIDDVLVSTDCESVSRIAKENGASVPFLRPENLADDYTGTAEVIKHAVAWYQENIAAVDYVLTVYPTAVFLSKEDIEKAFGILQNEDCENVFSATEYPFPIQRAIYLDEKKRVNMFHPECYSMRSQDLEPAYHDAGQFYFSTVEALDNDAPIFSNKSRLLVLPKSRVVDIDTPEDFILAEKLFKAMNVNDLNNRSRL
mgnify:CR=1 FL=1